MYNILERIISNLDFTVEIYQSDLDHYYFLMRYIALLPISQIVRRLKQQATHHIWQKHPVYLFKQFCRKQQFWSDGYFVYSIGEASPDTIRQYILSQG